MTGLGEVVRTVAERPDVTGAVLVSADGLPIQHAARGPLEAETVAALVATAARHAASLTDALALGAVETLVLECTGGLAVAARVGAGDWLLVLPADGADVGTLLYDLRRHRPALASLL
ncbi:MAG TPA: roadblock/LC7 domain-containing protein [Gemmatimonadales bacterium]|nr:roadblock/LC7 domain-containing protein [Gemmatimonadales bacterium]